MMKHPSNAIASWNQLAWDYILRMEYTTAAAASSNDSDAGCAHRPSTSFFRLSLVHSSFRSFRCLFALFTLCAIFFSADKVRQCHVLSNFNIYPEYPRNGWEPFVFRFYICLFNALFTTFRAEIFAWNGHIIRRFLLQSISFAAFVAKVLLCSNLTSLLAVILNVVLFLI